MSAVQLPQFNQLHSFPTFASATAPAPTTAPATASASASASAPAPVHTAKKVPSPVGVKLNNTADATTCSVCLEKFSTVGDKVPCVVACGHTFCKDCLSKGRLSKCPCCRAPFSSSLQLSRNYTLITLLESLGTKRELLPEMEYSFSQKVLVQQLEASQDKIRNLTIQMKSEEAKKEVYLASLPSAETLTDAQSDLFKSIDENISSLTAQVSQAEEDTFSKRLQLSSAICSSKNYLEKARKVKAEIQNPFVFTPTNTAFDSTKNIESTNKAMPFDFDSSNVFLGKVDLLNDTRGLKEIENALKITQEVDSYRLICAESEDQGKENIGMDSSTDTSNVVIDNRTVIQGEVSLTIPSLPAQDVTFNPHAARLRKKVVKGKEYKSVLTNDVLLNYSSPSESISCNLGLEFIYNLLF